MRKVLSVIVEVAPAEGRRDRSFRGLEASRLIFLTNEDAIHAPGLTALRRELQTLGEVHVVAPATEQNCVGHPITCLAPLIGGGCGRPYGFFAAGSFRLIPAAVRSESNRGAIR